MEAVGSLTGIPCLPGAYDCSGMAPLDVAVGSRAEKGREEGREAARAVEEVAMMNPELVGVSPRATLMTATVAMLVDIVGSGREAAGGSREDSACVTAAGGLAVVVGLLFGDGAGAGVSAAGRAEGEGAGRKAAREVEGAAGTTAVLAEKLLQRRQ